MLFSESLLPPDPRVHVVRDGRELPRWEQILSACGRRRKLSWDTETSGFDWWREARVIGHCFGYDLEDGHGARGVYFPMRHRTYEQQLDEHAVTALAKRILEDPGNQVITHYGKFDAHMARQDGIQIHAQIHLLEVLATLVDENEPKQLEKIAERCAVDSNPFFYKNLVQDQFREECRRRGVKQENAPGYAWLSSEVCGRYGATDARLTLAAAEALLPVVQAGWWSLYGTELAVWPVLLEAERVGLKIDIPYLQRLHADVEARAANLEEQIQKLAGYDLNPGSDAQTRDLVYERMKQPIHFFTDTVKYVDGQEVRSPAVDAVALRDIMHRTGSPLVKLILGWRDADKIRSTYTEPLIKHADDNGFIHGRLDQAGTKTGRLASKQPNLQNFPSEDKDGIRAAFLVPDGKVRVCMDFSQVELRILAFLSREPTMWAAFLNSEDIHAATSKRMNRPRRMAKVVNFGVAYGMSKYGVRDNLNKGADPEKGVPTIDDAQADALLSEWHGLFPRVGAWVQELCVDMCRHSSPPAYTNMFGRTRRIPELRASGAIGRRAIRQAVASMVQGTASELTKESLVRLQRICDWARATGRWEATIVTTIHDEIQADVDPHGAAEFAHLAKLEMERFPQFDPLPIIVEAEWTSTTWADKQPVWGEKK